MATTRFHTIFARMNIILFDGICNLCNSTVLFIIKRDHKEIFKFASLQSETGQGLLQRFHMPTHKMDTLFYIRGNICLQKSTAVIFILCDLGGLWKIFYLFKFIPTCIRDAIYQALANSRYRLFGKKADCMIPSAKIKSRFI